MITLARVVLFVAALAALSWTALAARLLRRLPHFRFLGPSDEPLPDDVPAIEAIVPARNEEAHIAGTVAALLAQEYPRLAVTVVDDRSMDRTGAVLAAMVSDPAAAGRLRVVAGAERPPGWVGKTWAVWQGVERSRGDWLWFVDADMGLHPKALRTAYHEAMRTGSDLVTLIPGVVCESSWQAAAALTLAEVLVHLHPIDRVNDPARPEALAMGGFILVRRSAYERAGGHEAARGEIVEDIALGRRVKAAGGRIRLRVAPELVWTHMYGSLGDIWRGLRKNAYAGMDYRFHKYITGAVVALAAALAPGLAGLLGAAGLASGAVGPGLGWGLIGLGVLGALMQALAALPLTVHLRISPLAGLTLPAGIVLYVAITTSSVWHYYRGRILWKDVTFAPTDAASPARPAGAGWVRPRRRRGRT